MLGKLVLFLAAAAVAPGVAYVKRKRTAPKPAPQAGQPGAKVFDGTPEEFAAHLAEKEERQRRADAQLAALKANTALSTKLNRIKKKLPGGDGRDLFDDLGDAIGVHASDVGKAAAVVGATAIGGPAAGAAVGTGMKLLK